MRQIFLVLVFAVAGGAGCTGGTVEPEDDWMTGAAKTAEEVRPLLPGMKAPDFEAQLSDGSTFLFDADLRESPSILVFYRGGWCPYCNRQLMSLRTIDDELVEMGYDLFFLSADRPEKLAEAPDTMEVRYTLVSDNELDVSKAFGIAFRLDDATIERYSNGGPDLIDASGYDHFLLPAPSIFIVDTTGVIQFQYTNPNYRVRLDNNVLLAAAKAALPE